MTKEEFENGYAERSGVTVGFLAQHGRVAMPCECGEEGCEGWEMGRVPMLTVTVDLEHPFIITGTVRRPMLAAEDADNEENAVRLAEGMVREAFRRWRKKNRKQSIILEPTKVEELRHVKRTDPDIKTGERNHD